MLKKEPIITQKNQLKIYIDDCYFDYSELLIHVLNKIENFSFYVLDKSSLNIKKSMSKNDILITFNDSSFDSFDYYISSKNEIRKLENNTFYILNKDYYNLGSNRERTIYFSTSKPCNCYISNIKKNNNLDIISICFNGEEYSLIYQHMEHTFYEFILIVICLLHDLSFNVDYILKLISTYIKKGA